MLSAALIAVPFVIYAVRKPHWRDPDNDFAPFTWEAEGGHPGIPTASGTATGSVVRAATAGKTRQGKARQGKALTANAF